MTERRIGIIMHGVTGRMGTNQHLVRSILAIREEGGIVLADGTRVLPEPILVGRDPRKLEQLADRYGLTRWMLDLEAALADTDAEIFFDAASTKLRAGLTLRAIAAGKHVYCEKPVADTLEDALRIWRAARAAGIRHGVVQDKLWLPGLCKLKMLIDAGFFGRICVVAASKKTSSFGSASAAARSVVHRSRPCRRASTSVFSALRPTRIGSGITRSPFLSCTPPSLRIARIERMRCWFVPIRPVTPCMMMPRRRVAIKPPEMGFCPLK